MKILDYISQNKEIYKILIEYVDNACSIDEENLFFANLDNILNGQKNREDLFIFLYLLLKISNNHHMSQNFLHNIIQILDHLKDNIKQTFSNYEIFKLFKNNKRILLYLFKEKLITPDEAIIQLFHQKKYFNDFKYCHFFYPEIKEYIDEKKRKEIEDEISKFEENFESNRQIGENHSYICSLIRNDLVEEFVAYVNRFNISLSSIINPSIFETNSLLLKIKETSLIDNATFCGAIQIFQYLRLNNVNLKSPLWIHAIHSNNPELIHLLEENQVELPNYKYSYERCLEEAIKCHHNDIVDYILNSLIKEQDENYNVENKYDQNVVAYSFHYFNFAYFPNDAGQNKFIFHYACQYNYIPLVKIFLNNKELDLNEQVVSSNQLFLLIKFI